MNPNAHDDAPLARSHAQDRQAQAGYAENSAHPRQRSHADYRLSPENYARATDRGLVSAQWYTCHVDRKVMKDLMKRSDRPALLNMALWFGLMIASALVAGITWGTLWCIPAFALYGVLFAASDHRAHELSHGTPFKTRWLNDVFYQIAAFMTFHEATYWRWSHTRHHTDTLVVGSDPEIAAPRPPSILNMVLDAFGLRSVPVEIARTVRHALGIVNAQTRSFVPQTAMPRMIWSSRVYVLIWAATVVSCFALDSLLPAMLLLLPRLYGGPITQALNLTQHTGLAENVLDHRLNCRTMYLGPFLRFVYMNMNYHIEHHMFPMVPYHALPRLHAVIKDQCPPPYPSLWAAWREIIPAVLHQRRDPHWSVQRPLRATPQPTDSVAMAGHGAA
ncbi:fatty acid desaturase [Pseudomonas sp. MWU16-30317]|uniref:fatty acid desaturase n=1 Tax=Pseudomonas sp. MWU16-30317 TaxID=2878095 RepID=UPI001CFBB363|nr:fatty acid desaturase [Pseudomonas sp. MWU16-30317]